MGQGAGGRGRGAASAGFTLVEVILVSVILVILIVGTLPRFQDTSQRLGAERAAFALAQLLRAAREQAVTRGQAAVWTWDASARRAQVEGGLRSSSPVPKGLLVSLTREGSSVDCECVHFFPDGTADPAQLTVTHRDLAYRVTVDAATGQAQLSRGPAPR